MSVWLSSVYALGHCSFVSKSAKTGKALGLIYYTLFMIQRRKLRLPKWVLDHAAFSTQRGVVETCGLITMAL